MASIAKAYLKHGISELERAPTTGGSLRSPKYDFGPMETASGMCDESDWIIELKSTPTPLE